MDSITLNGKWLAQLVLEGVRAEVDALRAAGKRVPGLGVILVGDNPASQAYVANKEKSAKKAGLETFDVRLPATASFTDVAAAIVEFNSDVRVDGILLQLPLPKHLNSAELLDLISAEKDADGLHPLNQGLMQRGPSRLRPCTPMGVMKLVDLAYSSGLKSDGMAQAQISEAALDGKHVVVVGRSVLVGKPVSFLCLERNATVTIAHSKTKDLAAVCRSADILIAAVGVPNLIRAECVQDGAVVIDVGINRLDNGKLCGDVDFADVAPKCRAISPVPGGVGPLTVAMLIRNTLSAYHMHAGLPIGSAVT